MVDDTLEGVHCCWIQDDRDASYLKHPVAVGVFDGLIGYPEGEMGLDDDDGDGAPDAGTIWRDPERSMSVRRAIADAVRRPVCAVKRLPCRFRANALCGLRVLINACRVHRSCRERITMCDRRGAKLRHRTPSPGTYLTEEPLKAILNDPRIERDDLMKYA